MISVSSAVVSHPARLDAGKKLAGVLGGELCVDEAGGREGARQNHLAAWRAALLDENATHCLVVEDDAVPVSGVHYQMADALSVAPSPVVSFYLGTGYPTVWQERIQDAVGRDEDWIVSPGDVLHAVALCVRRDLVENMLYTIDRFYKPIDEAIGVWCRRKGYRVAYSNPSLFNHRDDGSLTTHLDGPRELPRQAWSWGIRPRWCPNYTNL